MLAAWGAIIGTVMSNFVIAAVRFFRVNKYVKMEIGWVHLLLDIMIVFFRRFGGVSELAYLYNFYYCNYFICYKPCRYSQTI